MSSALYCQNFMVILLTVQEKSEFENCHLKRCVTVCKPRQKYIQSNSETYPFETTPYDKQQHSANNSINKYSSSFLK